MAHTPPPLPAASSRRSVIRCGSVLLGKQKHYYTSHAALNTYAIVPVGPDFIKTLEEPHDRDRTY